MYNIDPAVPRVKESMVINPSTKWYHKE